MSVTYGESYLKSENIFFFLLHLSIVLHLIISILQSFLNVSMYWDSLKGLLAYRVLGVAPPLEFPF
jgi:hypothetical protein